MKMPKSLSTWFMVLFFLFSGLAVFGITFGGSLFGTLTGLFALGAAVFLFIGK
ncbi:MAG: hypothetical protein AB1846_08190 [Chloroflexota bacterium]